jgi:hypothetical protein
MVAGSAFNTGGWEVISLASLLATRGWTAEHIIALQRSIPPIGQQEPVSTASILRSPYT